MTRALSLERRRVLHRRGLRLEWFTVGWNVLEGAVAIGAGLLAGSVALVGFGVDSSIEVISAIGLLWRLRTAGPDATVVEESAAERRALYMVAATFFLLAGYIAFEAGTALVGREEPDRSPVGLVLAVLSLVVMPALAYGKQRTGRWRPGCARTCRWCCWPASGSTPCSAGGGRMRSAPWPCSR
jgi:divalent metal cation (Fe/Co/Zn/Cd) transporter